MPARPALQELAAGPTPRGEGPRPGYPLPRHGPGTSDIAILPGCSGRERSSTAPPRKGFNKFLGVRFIEGNLGYGPSWMDGRPATILDYSETSHLYANYRDEIRQVGPRIFLGAMYSRTTPEPTFMMYFALQAPPARGRKFVARLVGASNPRCGLQSPVSRSGNSSPVRCEEARARPGIFTKVRGYHYVVLIILKIFDENTEVISSQ